MAAPTFVAAGVASGAVTAITPALPAGIATNDILLLHLETSDQAITIADSAGGTWAAPTNSPRSAAPTRITVFWSRYNGTQTAPTTSDSGDHQYGVITAYRGCPTTGDPWDVTAASDFGTIGDNFIGVTTTVADCLIVHAAVDDGDAAGAWLSGSTNAVLASITERHDAGTTQGNGGEIAIVTGIKATAGATGNTSYTYGGAGTNNAYHTIALKPATGAFEIVADAGSYALTGTAAQLEYDRIFVAEGGSYAISGTAIGLTGGFAIVAEAGSYALTGADADLALGGGGAPAGTSSRTYWHTSKRRR